MEKSPRPVPSEGEHFSAASKETVPSNMSLREEFAFRARSAMDSFMERFFHRGEEGDEEGEKKKGKKSKLRRLGEMGLGLLGIERQATTDESAPNSSRRHTPELGNYIFNREPIASEPDKPTASDENPETPKDAVEPQTELLFPSAESQEDVSLSAKKQESSSSQMEEAASIPEVEDQTVTREKETHPADPIPETIVPLHDTANQEVASNGGIAREATTSPIVEREIYYVADRQAEGLAVTAMGLTGIEVWRRRRADKKLERRIEKHEKRAEQARQQLTEQRERLEREMKQVSERLPSTAPVRTVERPIIERTLMPAVERPSRSVPEVRTETVTNSRMERVETAQPTTREKLRELITEPYKANNPEVILKKVAEAAKENAPIESLYERRHEVKDQPKEEFGQALASGAPQSSSQTPAYPVPMPPPVWPDTSRTPTNQPSSPQLYKQAVRKGLWGAAILLIAAALLLVLK